jgi:hypothetical protein
VTSTESGTTEHTVASAAADGDQLELLIAMRDRIAIEISDMTCPARDLSSLTLRLQTIAEKIAALQERQLQDDRESHPCPACEGTGVSRSGGRDDARATSNDSWQPE